MIDTFVITGDARVKQRNNPANNYGSLTTLRLRLGNSNNREINTYVQASVSGVGTVTSATLRLYSSDVNMGVDVYETSSFNESTITWNNAPGSIGGSLDDVNTTTGWTEFDVTSVVTGDGTYSFVLKGDADSSSRDFQSREGANAPELVIEHSGAGGGSSRGAGVTASVTAGVTGGAAIPSLGTLGMVILCGLLGFTGLRRTRG